MLEATIICVDNSTHMCMDAQMEAIRLIFGAKMQSNPNNGVGVLTMAGDMARLLVSPTNVYNNIVDCLEGVEVKGEMNLFCGIQIAQMLLTRLPNKKMLKTIIVFVGSPVNYDEDVLKLIGKNLRNQNIALDVVNFGEKDEQKLEAVIDAINRSHMVHLRGSKDLSTELMSHPIVTGSGFCFKRWSTWLQQFTSQDATRTKNQALPLSMEESSPEVSVRGTGIVDVSVEDHDLDLVLQLDKGDRSNDVSRVTMLLADQSFVSSIFASKKDKGKKPKQKEKK